MKRDGNRPSVPDLSWRQWILVGFAAFAVIGILFRTAVPADKAQMPTEQSMSPEQAVASAKTEPSQPVEAIKYTSWFTYENVDELRGAKNKFATVSSTNSVKFDFPYCCDSKLKITVRKTSQHGDDVIFQISDGQFKCGLYECSGMISFDGKPEKLTLATPEDGDPKTLFAKYPKPIIKKLNSSEETLIELPFYQEGRRQFKFNTFGLEWN